MTPNRPADTSAITTGVAQNATRGGSPPIAEQIRELEAAGWTRWRGRNHIWESPTGGIFNGPHGAWKALRGLA